ncbi:MAG: sigma-70 family RNA polymerase sigma factor [Gammaproteobacteria bacterium]|nr:sigma-70 family RNA polymerase sigma factor [Gammaproteobacteria bacterium]
MSRGFAQDIEPALLRAAKRGDHGAQAEIYRRFGPAAFTLARRLVKRHDVAEELLQEAFLDVLRRIGSFRGEAPLGAWIRRIVMNRCLMFLRSYWEQNNEELPEEVHADQVPTPDMHLEQLDLVKMLDALPAVSRAVVWLHDVEGYTHEEIGQMLDKSTSFSKSQLARAYQRLRQAATEVESCTQQPAS